jgi:general secretion pathway protein G
MQDMIRSDATRAGAERERKVERVRVNPGSVQGLVDPLFSGRMNMFARSVRKGFTLVEILIVVVILGILAAIVIPQFTSASETAKASSLVSQLQTIRSQLELFQVQHNGAYPTLAELNADWGVMTSRTNAQKAIMPGSGDPNEYPFGPYLQQPPRNPFWSGAGATALHGTALANTGWIYNEATGQMQASLPNGSDLVKLGISTTDAVVVAD